MHKKGDPWMHKKGETQSCAQMGGTLMQIKSRCRRTCAQTIQISTPVMMHKLKQKPQKSAIDRHHKQDTKKPTSIKNNPFQLPVKGSKLMRTVAEAVVHGRKEKYETTDDKQHDSRVPPHDFPHCWDEASAAHHEEGVAEHIKITVNR